MKISFLKSLFIISIILIFTSCTSNNPIVEIDKEWKDNNITENIESDTRTDSEDSKENTMSWKENEENENTMTEEEFNDSWSAKAIENETDLWNFFDDENIGLSLNYPLGSELLSEDQYPTDLNETYFKVSLKEIWDQENPSDFSKEDQEKNIEELSAWKFWVQNWFSLPESEKVKTVWFLFAQDYITLSRFEVCDVTLERELVFYYNNKEVKVTSFAPVNKLKELMPEYFITDKDNCPDDVMWDFEKQKDFYKTLNEGNAPEEIQNWFDDFDKMSETIIFDNK